MAVDLDFLNNILSTESLSDIWKESEPDELTWIKYAEDAQKYLNRPAFDGTHITGKMLADSARLNYIKNKKILPVEFVLAQLQKESTMGTKGRSPKNNPANVGEYDEGTKIKFNSPEEGINAYYSLISNDYLRDKNVSDLISNFVNYRGDRYATDPGYEKYFQDQIPFIERFLSK